MIDPHNAAALVVALADLEHAGQVDLTDLETDDLITVVGALTREQAARLTQLSAE